MKDILNEIKEKLNGEISAEVNGVSYSVVKEGDANIYRVLFYGDEIRARSVRLEEYTNGDIQLYYAGFYSEAGVLEALKENQEPEQEEETETETEEENPQ